eukprot:CAMPEP_0185419786 /NCGR_PEP_ID=MMETSP1365-20130426/9787_1 /TAXON_ID=38817 /ORGANISM="Gephyrocapsa oceanica, Strain RCC1303" /LENGTH=159 /DNA_ID=CAMNT_0028023353 /DNA_START=40 /DNA_END=516 /DNA_ORIENTATION=+
MRLERLFASLRTEHGTLATLEVLEFDALQLGRSRVLTAPPACKHLIGREYPSLGGAAHDIHQQLYGTGRCDYLVAYESYVTGLGAQHIRALGTSRTPVRRHGERQSFTAYSPFLATTPVQVLRDANGRGRWIPVGWLRPLARLATPPRGVPAAAQHGGG